MTRAFRSAAHVLALIGISWTSSAALAQDTKIRFVLDWAFQGQQSVFTIPADDGTYKKLKLDVTVDRGVGSGDSVAKVASGAYDIALTDLYSMVRFNGQNANNKLIAVMSVHDKSALSIATKKTSGIKVPADLNGKTIAAPIGDASRQLFPLFADINKVDNSSLKWVNVTPALREPMLIRNEADAIAGHITTVLMNLRGVGVSEKDIHVMPYADYGVELYGHVLAVNPAFAEKNPEAIKNFIRATVHGIRAMRNDPVAAVATIKKRDPLINDQIEIDRIKMSLDYMFITPNVLQNGVSNVDMARLDRTLKASAKAFEIAVPPAAAEVYPDKYLPPRSELMLTGK